MSESKDMTSRGNGWKRTKITKRAKSVDVFIHEVKQTYPEYTCPSCHTTFKGGSPGNSVIRFICVCGQELIVRSRKLINPKTGTADWHIGKEA